MRTIDRLSYQSKLRYMNASEKFVFAVATLLICVTARSIVLALIILLTNGVLSVGIGGTPMRQYRKLMAVPLAFLVLSTIAIIVNFSQVPLDAYALRLWNGWYLTGSRASLLFACRLILTALAAVSSLYFLSLNTTMTDILLVLHRLHCPLILREMMLLIYRFIFVLLDYAENMTTSQHARLGNRDMKTTWHSFGTMASGLFIRAMKKADRLYDAMESRCYTGDIRVLEQDYSPKAAEIAAMACFDLLMLGLYFGMRTAGCLL